MQLYAAFLSYSRRDAAFARQLHTALESYRIPKRAGQSRVSKRPDRIAPIFRDQDEASASANLTQTLRDALASSSALIVVASPDAARSRWVNAEVEEFRLLGRGNRIFLAIPPYLREDPALPLRANFPRALQSGAEPLAADFRREADGWKLAKLKLVAGVAGIDLVRLRDRDAARRLRRTVTAAIAALAVIGVVGWAGHSAYEADLRAGRERTGRAFEGIRASLAADQPGQALAVMDGVDRGALAPAAVDGLERLRKFWRANLVSPRDTIAAAGPGTTFRIRDKLYFRTAAGVVPLAVEGAHHIYQGPQSGRLIAAAGNNLLYALDPATGSATRLLPDAPEKWAISEIYELPGGTVLVVGSNATDLIEGRSMGSTHEIAVAIYPDGATSGVVQTMVFTTFHADAACTKLYFGEGDPGFGHITPGAPDPSFTQIIYSDPQAFNDTGEVFPAPFRLGVTTLTRPEGWQETPLAPGSVDPYSASSYASEWLAARGQELNVACQPYLMPSTVVSGNSLAITIPTFAGDGWRQDDALARDRAWAAEGAWADAARSSNEWDVGMPAAPDDFATTPDGRFAYYVFLGNGSMGVTVCNALPGAAPRCTSRGTPDGAFSNIFLPRSALLYLGPQFVDLLTLEDVSWPDNLGATSLHVAEAPSGRALMAIGTTGELAVYARSPGAPLASVRSISRTELAEPAALAALDDRDALVLTRDGRLLRVDTEQGQILWQLSDRAIVAPADPAIPVISATMAASPLGQYAVIAGPTAVRLYETTIGVPLTRLYRLKDWGMGAIYQPALEIDDAGTVIIRDNQGIDAGDGIAFVRDAPAAAPAQDVEPVCLYGAEVVAGKVRPVEILADPAMMRRCGLESIAPAAP